MRFASGWPGTTVGKTLSARAPPWWAVGAGRPAARGLAVAMRPAPSKPSPVEVLASPEEAASLAAAPTQEAARAILAATATPNPACSSPQHAGYMQLDMPAATGRMPERTRNMPNHLRVPAWSSVMRSWPAGHGRAHGGARRPRRESNPLRSALDRPYVIFYYGVSWADLGFCRLVAPDGDLRSWLRWLRCVEAERDGLAEQLEYAALFRGRR